MTVLVNWQSAAALAAGLAVLLGLTRLLRGARAMVRTCLALAAGIIVLGMATGSVPTVAVGGIVLAVDCWCYASLREPGGRR